MTETIVQKQTAVTTGEVTVCGKGVLTGMLTDLALTASTDQTKRVELLTLRLHTEGGRVHGWSSDAYRLAHARTTGDGDLPGVVFLYASDVKRVAQAFRASSVVILRVDTAAGSLTFADRDGSMAVVVPLVDVTDSARAFRNVAKDAVPPATTVTEFQGRYFEDFGKIAKRRGAHLALATDANPNRPAHVRIGPDYRAWVMPMQNSDVDTAEWLPSVF
jgi:hypothetical protein